jgi:prophage regulatory protein
MHNANMESETYSYTNQTTREINMKRLLRMKEILQITAIGRSTLYLYMSQNRFPKSIKIGYRSVAWREEDIQEWMERCVADKEIYENN